MNIFSTIVRTGAALSVLLALGAGNTAFAASNPNVSQNWAGYVANTANTNYTSVSGSWVLPSVPTTSTLSADATWVGIGGTNGSSNLIQAGTQAITENNQIVYQAWYEILPNASVPVSLTVKPGDMVSASITNQSGSTWLVTIVDNTTGMRYSQTVQYNSTESSAEWIEEMPSDGTNFLPLDNFGAVVFSNASATANSASGNITQVGAHAVTMFNGQQTLANTSVLGSDGASFTVSRTAAASDVTAPQVVQIGRGFSRDGRGARGFGQTGSTTPAISYTTYPAGNAQSAQSPQIQQTFRIIRYFVSPNGTVTTDSSSTTQNTQTYTYNFGGSAFTIQVNW